MGRSQACSLGLRFLGSGLCPEPALVSSTGAGLPCLLRFRERAPPFPRRRKAALAVVARSRQSHRIVRGPKRSPADSRRHEGATAERIPTMRAELLVVVRRALALSLLLLLPGPSHANKGIWMTQAQIDSLPMSGMAWDTLFFYANQAIGNPDLSNQEEKTNALVLAKALVYARTRISSYRTAVVNSINYIATEETENDSKDALAISRKLCAYIIAADLVGLDSGVDDAFKAWLGPVRFELMGPPPDPDESDNRRSLISTHEERPNNWGTHAGASRAAAAVYLGDDVDL